MKVYALLLVALAGCSSSTTAPPPPQSYFVIRLVGDQNACHLDIYSPVSWSRNVALGAQIKDSVAHAPGRFRFDWHVSIGLTDLYAGPYDSTTVPGGFDMYC